MALRQCLLRAWTGQEPDQAAQDATGFRSHIRHRQSYRGLLVDAAVRAAVFDGFSIGSNDLTQLKLGVDRDSEIVAFDFDERDPCMSEMLRLAVAGTKRNGRHVGICGEAPAKFRRSLNFSPASVSVAASEGNIAAASGGPTIGADKDWGAAGR